MKKVFNVVSVVFLFLLVLGFVCSGGVMASSFQEVKLIADDPVRNAEFGRSVAIAGNLVAVGAGGANAGSVANAGAVYLFRRRGQTYVPEAKLVAPDATAEAEFGRAVAIQGNMVIVGARFAQVGAVSKAGAVYVFRKCKGLWHFEEKIVSPTPVDEDNFGRALAIEGNLLVVTARKEDAAESDVGAAYVFRYKGGTWAFKAKLTASDAAAGAYFGQSVAVHRNAIAVGARNANPNGAGAVYLFRGSRNGWVEFAKVTPPGGKKNDHFGFTIAMAGDVIAVGARRADIDDLTDSGAAYVYSLDGDSVELVTMLTASDAKAKDEFGQSIAMAGDVLAVGAWKSEGGNGSVYLFHRMGNEWSEMKKLIASDGVSGDEFGYSLAAFGNRMVTGAHYANSKEGAAYVIPLKP